MKRKIGVLAMVAAAILGPMLVAACVSNQKKETAVKWVGGAGNILGQPPEFYGTKEALRIAETILLHQRNNGGWPKNYNSTRKLTEADRTKLLAEKGLKNTTFDNGATHTEARYLAKVYNASGDERYKKAVVRSVEFMLSAQYPTGGWPQSHPKGRGFMRNITFNDGAMTNVVAVLKDIAEDKKAFPFIDDKLRARCSKAVAKGIECILKCQIVVDGKRTAWCAQHNTVTLAPTGGRSYELPSISGHESIGVIRLLMSIDNPPPEIIDAIQSAVAWFDEAKLTGIKVVRREDKSAPRGFDQVIVKDPAAPPIWARFYQIGTNKPLFCLRNGIPVNTYAELSSERRTGYTWLWPFATEFLAKEYPVWQKKWAPGDNVLEREPDGTEKLYNGIVLPEQWPPTAGKLTREPMSPPYLASPPDVISIDVGRQLFVDDFLIEQTTLKRKFHLAEYHPSSPVLRPDKPWETGPTKRLAPTAMVFSDGVWYDPQDKLFKMWYMGGYVRSTCYAVSKDGIAWEKPVLDVKPGTNVVLDGHRDSATVWLDHEEKDPKKRFKLFVVRHPAGHWAGFVYVSPDGIHWGKPVAQTTGIGDRSTVFYNPFRKKWVYSIRSGFPGMGRSRRYREHADVIAGAKWKPGEAPLWVGADKNDPPRPDLKTPPQLYNLDAVAYESVMLGLFTIWPGQPRDRAKPNYVSLGFSRDGFHWDRPDHRPFIGVSEKYGDWNWGNVQSAGGGCLVVGDKLYFYVSARAGVKGSGTSGVCTTGLAVLRRDGFASMDAGAAEGTLTTRTVRFSGRHMFVNVAAAEGELRVEALDEDGKAIAPFTLANCVPIRADKTLQPVNWKGAIDMYGLAGRRVKFRFHLRNGQLYAFWVGPRPDGASNGYVAAGGPGFVGPTDTVGSPAYKAAAKLHRK